MRLISALTVIAMLVVTSVLGERFFRNNFWL